MTTRVPNSKNVFKRPVMAHDLWLITDESSVILVRISYRIWAVKHLRILVYILEAFLGHFRNMFSLDFSEIKIFLHYHDTMQSFRFLEKDSSKILSFYRQFTLKKFNFDGFRFEIFCMRERERE